MCRKPRRRLTSAPFLNSPDGSREQDTQYLAAISFFVIELMVRSVVVDFDVGEPWWLIGACGIFVVVCLQYPRLLVSLTPTPPPPPPRTLTLFAGSSLEIAGPLRGGW